jgi:hypothetical protein
MRFASTEKPHKWQRTAPANSRIGCSSNRPLLNRFMLDALLPLLLRLAGFLKRSDAPKMPGLFMSCDYEQRDEIRLGVSCQKPTILRPDSTTEHTEYSVVYSIPPITANETRGPKVSRARRARMRESDQRFRTVQAGPGLGQAWRHILGTYADQLQRSRLRA